MIHRIIHSLTLLLAIPIAALAVEHSAHEYDIRVVIDTSGSMKLNDPNNLRTPALKLLVNILPTGSRAGVWLFDSTPQELVPSGTVDANWKENALQAAARIHSKGLFTHIEAALAASAKDWSEPATEGSHRNLILLTDGMVDLSEQPQESAASRERIFNDLLPRFQQLGIRIHTIALSGQSDQELLRQIALATGGWNEMAQNAEQLQRTFIQIFNKAAPHDSVPLRDNQFSVDASIEEFTVLVLLRPEAKPTRLVAPDQSEIAQDHAPENARWVHEQAYDLVTVSQPAAGQWKLEADIDPDNQVLVVTHLKMDVTPIQNYLTPGENPDISASFSENGRPVSRENFLNLLSVKATLTDAMGKKDFPMARDAARPGWFSLNPVEPFKPGNYTLTITADGKTFQREATQTFQVMQDSIKVETAPDHSSAAPGLTVTLTPNPAAVIPDSLVIQATLTDQSNQSKALDPERRDSGWRLSLPLPGPEDRWVVNFSVTAKTPEGKDIRVPLKPLRIAPETADHPASKTPEEEHPLPATQEEMQPRAKPDWTLTAAIAIGINILMLIGGSLGYRRIKKRSEAAITRLLSGLSP